MSDWRLIPTTDPGSERNSLTMDAVLRAISAEYECVNGLPLPISQTGEEYTEIVYKSQWGQTKSEAIASWYDLFKTYAQGKAGKLYWRIHPEVGDALEILPDHKQISVRYSVYARLLISDRAAEAAVNGDD